MHVDHIKTTLRIKGRPAATIFSHLLQTGLWDDNALTHIIQFQADRIGQYPTFESAIPAYIAYRDNLTPVTKAWVSLVVGALPLAPIQPQFETDLYEWIRLATGAHGVSQTNLPLFLERYEIELKESLHNAGTMGRFGTDDSPLLNRLIPLIIRAFSEARPDWKSLQTAPSIATALRDRDAHLQHQKTRLLADWEILIAQLIKYTAWSDAEAREFVLRYPTDFNPKGGVKFNLGSNKLTHTDFDKFLINHVEKEIIDSLMPNAYIKPIIEAWREVRNKNCQPLQRAQLIDASIYGHLEVRAGMYQAAGLPSNEWAYAEKWINTQHFFTLPPWNSRAWIMRDPKFVPTEALVKKGIDEAILNRIPVLRNLLPSWREKEPNRSIQVLADRFTSLRDVGLIINPGVFAARDHPRFAPSFPQLFPQTIETPPRPQH